MFYDTESCETVQIIEKHVTSVDGCCPQECTEPFLEWTPECDFNPPPPPPDIPYEYVGGCNGSTQYYPCSEVYDDAVQFDKKFSGIAEAWYFTSTGSDGKEYKCMASYKTAGGARVNNITSDYHSVDPATSNDCMSTKAFDALQKTDGLGYDSCDGEPHFFDTGIHTTTGDPGSTSGCAEGSGECTVIASEIPEGEKGDDDPDGSDGCGSPTWNVNMVNMNFFITDTPLWYNPPVGPAVNIKLSYNSRSSAVTGSPFGGKWNFNYSSYLTEDVDGNVTITMSDGREDIYTYNGVDGYTNERGVINSLTKYTGYFDLEFPDGTVFVYDRLSGTDTFFLGKIRDAYGNELAIEYDVNDRITTITDATSKVFTFNYDVGSDDLADSVSDPFGRSAQFVYDGSNNLQKITDMEGYWAEFAYDANGFISSITKGKGAVTSGTWTFYIEPSDDTINRTDPYPASGETLGEGYRITITDPMGNKEEYYSLGTYSWYVSPRDYVPYKSADDNNYKKAKKTLYFLTESKDTGKISKIVYPEGGYTKFMDHNSVSGEPETIIHSHGGGATHTETYTYTANGLVETSTDAKGNKTTYIYYPNNIDVQEVRYDLCSTPEDDNILLRSFTYNGDTHDIATSTDRYGTVTEFIYKPNGQIDKITGAKGTDVEMTTEMVYDAGTYELVNIKKGGSVAESFTYDDKGRVWTRTDDKGIVLTYEYNNLDKVKKITSPDTRFETTTYSNCCPGLIDTVTDRAGLVTKYIYDDAKRLTEVHGPKGVIKYGYDRNGNRTKLTDADGKETIFEYDLDNRLKKNTYDDGNYVSFEYDPSGLLKEFTNARGTTKRYYYDGNHNTTKIDYFDETMTDVEYTYDDYNRVKTMHDEVGDYIYTYDDPVDRMVKVDGPWENDDVISYYNEHGHVTSIVPQGGRTISYYYDYEAAYTSDADIGRLKEVQIGTDPSNKYTYAYTGVNPLINSLTRPNESQTIYDHSDPLKRLKAITNKTIIDTVETTIDEHAFDYNDLDVISTETVTTSDLINLPTGQTTYTYNNNVNQLIDSSDVPESYTYDLDGNMTKGFTPDGYKFTATYDPENRLKTVSYDDGSNDYETRYFYSGDGFLARIEKWDDTVTPGTLAKMDEVRFIRSGFLPIQERNDSNVVLREYTWGLEKGGGIGGLLNLKDGTADYSYLYDGKGNVMAVLDSNQTAVASYRYDEFGNRVNKTGTLEQPFQFSTKRYDTQTGLSYYGYRFYNPAIGRWMTRDPLGEFDDINLYRFADNSPMNVIDPYGLFGLKDIGDFAAGFGDTITFGGTAWIRSHWEKNLNWSDPTNECSGYYTGGEVAGYAWGAATLGVGSTPRGWLLGRGGGLLNSNDYIRLGWSWKGSAMEGKEILRLAIGSKRLPFHWHFP